MTHNILDFEAIARKIDILRLIESDTTLKRVSSTEGGEWHGSCPFCHSRDSLHVQPHSSKRPRWFCRKCTNGRYRDAIDYLATRDNITPYEAAKLLAGNDAPTRSNPLPKPAQTAVLTAPPNDIWQTAAMTAIAESCAYLHSGATAVLPVMAYLKEMRGLTYETIVNASLGYNPTWKKYDDYWLAPGITIPCLAGDSVWYVQVRTSKEARRGRKLEKYHAMSGSKLGALYGANELAAADHGVIVEGEFDALLLSQFTGDGTAVGTMGSATSRPDAYWRLYLGRLRSLRLAMDNDEAGQMAVTAWRKLIPHVELMPQLAQNDITDCWRSGVDLSEWFRAAC